MRFNKKYLILALIIIISLVIFDQFYQLKYQEGAANPAPAPPSESDVYDNLVIVENILNGTTKITGDGTTITCLREGKTAPDIINYSTKNTIALSYNDCFQAILGICKKAVGSDEMTGTKPARIFYANGLLEGNNVDSIPYLQIYSAHLKQLSTSIAIINNYSNPNSQLSQILYNNAILFFDEKNNFSYAISFKESLSYVNKLLGVITTKVLDPTNMDKEYICYYSLAPMPDPDKKSGALAPRGYVQITSDVLVNLLSKYTGNLYTPTKPPLGVKYTSDNPDFITYLENDLVGFPSTKNLGAYAPNPLTGKGLFEIVNNKPKRTDNPFPSQISGPNIMPPKPTSIPTTARPTTTTTTARPTTTTTTARPTTTTERPTTTTAPPKK